MYCFCRVRTDRTMSCGSTLPCPAGRQSREKNMSVRQMGPYLVKSICVIALLFPSISIFFLVRIVSLSLKGPNPIRLQRYEKIISRQKFSVGKSYLFVSFIEKCYLYLSFFLFIATFSLQKKMNGRAWAILRVPLLFRPCACALP